MNRAPSIKVIETHLRPDAMLLRACAGFGLSLRRVRAPLPAHHQELQDCAAWLDSSLAPGKVALLVGPSGSGKSTLLRLLRARLRKAGRPVVGPESPAAKLRPERSILSALRGSLQDRLSVLAAAGLAEAGLLARTPRELSQGQLFRLLLARVMQRATLSSATLLCDEFASTLDRRTARTLSLVLRRWAARHGVRAVMATAHDDLLEPLDPELLVSLDLEMPAQGLARRSACRAPPAVGGTHGTFDPGAMDASPPGFWARPG